MRRQRGAPTHRAPYRCSEYSGVFVYRAYSDHTPVYTWYHGWTGGSHRCRSKRHSITEGFCSILGRAGWFKTRRAPPKYTRGASNAT
jgi:hypothetical protein